MIKETMRKENQEKLQQTSFIVLEHGQIAEMVCDRSKQKVQFAVYDKENSEAYSIDYVTYSGKQIIPYQKDNLIMPSNPSEFPSVFHHAQKNMTLINSYLMK